MLMDVQADESESYGDILNLLKLGITKYDTKDHTQLLKTMSKCLKKVPMSATKEVTQSLI
jgi:hypothetical protein